jgi:hypothetical protein
LILQLFRVIHTDILKDIYIVRHQTHRDMVSETNVATAALAIAISALVIAAGQLIAQLFSTADGYRRCQPSVIGDWYKLVELKFRW